MASTKKAFLADIETFMKKHKMSPTTFGRNFCKSPNFVFDLRAGRAPNADVMDAIDAKMSSFNA